MTAPDYSRGYLRVPLVVWEAVYCRGPLTRRQLQVFSVVLRESWGWQTKGGEPRLWTRPLSVAQFAQATGLAPSHVRTTLRDLLARGILREADRHYQAVADPSLWITPPSVGVVHTVLDEKRTLSDGNQTVLDGVRRDIKRPIDKIKIDNRNGTPAAYRTLPPGDNSPVESAAPPIEEKLVAILIAFVGPLSADKIVRLREWIGREGIAIVWRTLEPALRQGPSAARVALAERLTRRG